MPPTATTSVNVICSASNVEPDGETETGLPEPVAEPDIEHLAVERGHRTLTITRKRRYVWPSLDTQSYASTIK
ncbi:MAG: hypothetical protein ABR609_01315 [Acidimicrobiia bacterium]